MAYRGRMEMTMTRKMYRASQFAEALEVSRETLYNRIARGDIEPAREIVDATGRVVALWDARYVEQMVRQFGKKRS